MWIDALTQDREEHRGWNVVLQCHPLYISFEKWTFNNDEYENDSNNACGNNEKVTLLPLIKTVEFCEPRNYKGKCSVKPITVILVLND